MKFDCIKCGKFICKLDLRRFENKDEHPLYCGACLKENIATTRVLFKE